MKIERKIIDPTKNIIQITTQDERWYFDGEEYLPSVTWICSFYPKGIGYFKWLAAKGWDEAESLKTEAGQKGSRVHHAIEQLINGQTIKHDDKFSNGNGGPEELTADEYEAVLSFVAWFRSTPNLSIKSAEMAVFDRKLGYAGTVDIVAEIGGEQWIIDIKTSADIWPSHELQVSAYAKALGITNRAILQVGYKRNKNKYKFTPVEDKYDLFLAAKQIWVAETAGTSPLQREFPIEITLAKGD